MKNPWLDVPLDDYEGHMALPYVGQAQLLSDVFAESLRRYSPRSVAMLGCAGGNGLERVATDVTERVVGVDLNPHYIEQVRVRFHHRIPVLELIEGDVQTDEFAFTPVELAFAGLLLEYVDVDAALGRIRSMLLPGGRLVTVVQLPSATLPEVTPSPFASLGALSPVMRLVPPEVLRRLAAARGFQATDAQKVMAAGGKQFLVQAFCVDRQDTGQANSAADAS
jgi:ubiquinone/menaquinone biosynthesis C-methylase UbiE